MKSGWQTTEFWLSLIAQVLPILVILKLVPNTDVDQLQTNLNTIVMSVGSLAVAGINLYSYVSSRTNLKKAHVELQAIEARARCK